MFLLLCAGAQLALAQFHDLGPMPEVEVQCLTESPTARRLDVDPWADGTWLQYRRDRELTGRSPLKGAITCPEVLWILDLGARRHLVSVTPGDGQSSLALPLSDPPENNWGTWDEFEVRGQRVDVDGDGYSETSLHDNFRVGDLLPGLPGYERVECSGRSNGVCRMENYSGGWTTVWTSDPVDFGHGYGNKPVIGDFDNDGRDELAISPWYSLRVYDLETGVQETSANFFQDDAIDNVTSGRAYGWLGAHDIDDDPEIELIILGNFEQFISVFDWVNGEVVELWDLRIEHGTTRNEAIHETGAYPVADVDGDGRAEISTSVYNMNGDHRWHVYVFDGKSGALKLDLPDAHLEGIGDVDGDGVSELFVREAQGAAVVEHGDSRILSFSNQQLETRWSSNQETFEIYEFPNAPPHIKFAAPYRFLAAFLRDDWTSGFPVFITRQATGNGPMVALRFYQWNGDAIVLIARAEGPRLEVFATSQTAPEKGILLRSFTLSAAEAELSLENLDARIQNSSHLNSQDGDWNHAQPFTHSVAVAPLRAGDKPTLLISDYFEQLHAYRLEGGTRPLLQWQVHGRDMYDGERLVASDYATAPVLLADLHGDGRRSIITSRSGNSNEGVIAALADNGATLWETPFNTKGAVPEYDAPGLANWLAGRFRNTEREDILVGIRRSIHTTEEVTLLDGRTGSPLWRRDISGKNSDCPWTIPEIGVSGQGGMQMPVFDWDGNGLDDVLDTHHGLFDVIRGSDGSLLLDRWTGHAPGCPNERSIFTSGGSDSAFATVFDANQDGQAEVLLGANQATIALLEFSGDPIWHTPIFAGKASSTFQGIGNISSNPGLEVISVAHCGQPGEEIQLYSASTGQHLDSLALPDICGFPMARAVNTSDLDGDGYDEAVFTQSNRLYAVGSGENGLEIRWQAEFEEAIMLGESAIADLDGTGRPQILVQDENQQLYALGTSAPAVVRGMYYDRAKDGHGIDLQKVGSNWFLVFYTYRDDGTPVWFLAVAPLEGGVFEGELLSFSYVDQNFVEEGPVGNIRIDFNDPEQSPACSDGVDRSNARNLGAGTVTYNGSAPGNICFELLAAALGRPAADHTGHWWATAADEGWGMTAYFQGYEGEVEFVVLYYYDGSGSPRWALGVADSPGPSAEMELLNFTGYCLSCPVSATSHTTIGTLSHAFNALESEFNSGVLDIDIEYPGEEGGQWVRQKTYIERLSDPP